MGFLCVAGILTRQVGFESKGLELDLQKTAADYSFDPSEQAGKNLAIWGRMDCGPIRRFVFFLVRVLFGYFTPWNFVFRPPKKSLRIPQHMLLMMIFSYRIVQTWCF